jgi:y4mF family transcriptional regulator
VVAARREELSLRQDELADLADVSVRFVHAVESGRRSISLDRLLAVLTALGLHLELERGLTDEPVVAGAALAAGYGLTPHDSADG